jgi:serine/threonine protein kinase
VLSSNQKNISYICSRYYRAPELLLGAVFYTYQVDIWSLGCVIAEMMTNHGLFEGSTATSMLSKIIKCLGSPTVEDLKSMNIEDEEMGLMNLEGSGLRNRILKFNPNCSEDLLDLVARMVVYDPKRRITAAEALSLPLFN